MTLATLLLTLIALPGAEASRPANPVLLDFYSDSCGPCQMMKPALKMLASKGYPIKGVNTGTSPDLAARYEIQAVPTFVVVDSKGRELARTEGYQEAAQLARFYRDARDRYFSTLTARAQSPDEEDTEQTAQTSDASADSDEDSLASGDAPYPWETGVRIKIYGHGGVVNGSGTIIRSTAEEAIVLTCAHVFKIDGARQQPRPEQFPLRIQVDLFDGVLHGSKPAMVHPIGSVRGEAIDYDFTTDVGLIRIRPGRRLAATPVVPPHWRPKVGLKMHTVGCSEGHDATAWTTYITDTKVQGLSDGRGRLIRNYSAIQCQYAPREGRSGGGLYTVDGFLAGVCNFQEPGAGQGLYACPDSIYQMLDRNRLQVCYNPSAAPERGRTAIASRETEPTPRIKYRGQSPRPESAESARILPIPGPELVASLPDDLTESSDDDHPATIRRTAKLPGWHGIERDRAGGKSALTSRDDHAVRRRVAASGSTLDEEIESRSIQAVATDLEIDPSVDPDAWADNEGSTTPKPVDRVEPIGWHAVKIVPPEAESN